MSNDPKKFYLTTPIYYVNARPHIGHAYTTIVADVLARRHRLLGDDTFFLTGTDEHGQKIERSAAAAGIPPQQFADQVSQSFAGLWQRMGMLDDSFSKDDPLLHRSFIRTTDPRHIQGAQKLFADLYARGQIYLSSYTGQYSIGEEMFVDGPPGTLGPDGRPTETVTEENFFFRLSDYQLPLLNLIESNQLLITPDSARNEVLSFLCGDWRSVLKEYLANYPVEVAPDETDEDGFLPSGDDGLVPAINWAIKSNRLKQVGEYLYVPGALRDLSVSRSSFTWGIPVPDDILRNAGTTQKHIIYVWLDALANYMTAIGYGSPAPAEQQKFEHFWPADLHLVGKEITRFHCVYWPAFLLALNPALLPSAQTTPPANTVILSEASQSHREAQSKDPEEANTTHTHHATLAPNPARQLSMAQHQAWATKMLPKQITAHGWLLFDNSKMSKSKGNIVRTETILDAFGDHVYAKQFPDSTKTERDLFASDVLRYFLLREIPFGQDGSFSFDALITRYNADLANGYGNLVSRTLKLVEQNMPDGFEIATTPWLCPDRNVFREGQEPKSREEAQSGTHFISQQITSFVGFCDEQLWPHNKFQVFLAELALRVSFVDSYLSFHKPWILAKSSEERDKRKLVEVLYTASEAIRIITAILYSVMPTTTARVWAQLGLGDIELAAKNGELNNLQWGGLKPGTRLGPLAPIFPRADKGLTDIMLNMEENQLATGNSKLEAGNQIPSPTGPLEAQSAKLTAESQTPQAAAPAGTTPLAAQPSPIPSQITIDDFAKVELRVAQILVAERIPKADKLLRLEVDLGDEKRQILSGIAEWYAPEDLIGRRIVVIANLAPRKMRGLESHGMLLAASADEAGKPGKPILATMAEDIALGSHLK